MSYTRKEFKGLIARAKKVYKKNYKKNNFSDPSCGLIEEYIKAAEDNIPGAKEYTNSHQEELYKKLEAAVGP